MKRPQLWQRRLTLSHEELQQARVVCIGVHRCYRRLLWLLPLPLWLLLLAFAWHWLFFVALCALAYLRESLFVLAADSLFPPGGVPGHPTSPRLPPSLRLRRTRRRTCRWPGFQLDPRCDLFLERLVGQCFSRRISERFCSPQSAARSSLTLGALISWLRSAAWLYPFVSSLDGTAWPHSYSR